MEKKNFCWDKSKINMSIDILMLLLMMPLAGIGFLIKYVLVPGSKRNELYGGGIDLEFWGLDRHEWGQIHFIISIVLLVLLVLHIIFHWKMIVCIFRRMVPNKVLGNTLAIVLGLISLGMIAFALFVSPECVEHEPLYRNRDNHSPGPQREFRSFSGFSERQQMNSREVVAEDSARMVQEEKIEKKAESHAPDEQFHNEYPESYYEINGSQTLQYVAEKYGVDLTKLAADLNIPVSLAGERLGRLKRQYPFTMDDVRESIRKNKK
ncbi:MAG: DUF4405 domain-containing protein [Prolixibacteraceae bacterium]|jgi:hypothetical protein|nr:DUF4405 domain-containing protein [Prolixibacteraceae bacterium]